MIEVCCDKMAEHLKQGELYRLTPCDGAYAVPGCCGGGCYVMADVRFCPFCGKPIATKEPPR